MNLNHRAWTIDELATIRAMFAAGSSARKIAVALGHNITRNMVCGKLRKMGLRRDPTKAPVKRPRIKLAMVGKAAKPTDPVPTEHLHNGQCKFVTTDAAPWMHCAAETPSVIDAWCAKHRRIVYQRQPATPEARARSREAARAMARTGM